MLEDAIDKLNKIGIKHIMEGGRMVAFNGLMRLKDKALNQKTNQKHWQDVFMEAVNNYYKKYETQQNIKENR